jgi:hypothetical protein
MKTARTRAEAETIAPGFFDSLVWMSSDTPYRSDCVEEDRGMKMINQGKRLALGVLLMVTVLGSCASIPILEITYGIPPDSNSLEGKEVSFRVLDARSDKDMIGPGAEKDLEQWAGDFYLSLARGTKRGFRKGIYGLPQLLEEVFRKRLETVGVKVVEAPGGEHPALVVALNGFFLDLTTVSVVEKKWVATLEYEARLENPDGSMAKQTISGKHEKTKLIGLKQANEMLGDLVTDAVNRLDLERLFEQAGV